MVRLEAPQLSTGSPPLAGRDFDLETYLDWRAQDPAFVMVEFGHGDYPVAYDQPGGFTGQRAYIGLEAWLRHPLGPIQLSLIEELQDKHQGQNIIYLDQSLGKHGESNRQTVGRPSKTSDRETFIGPYDPVTILPDGAADELFLSNVFGDGHVAHSIQRSRLLLAEVSRLTAENGLVVIREGFTPDKARPRLSAKMIEQAGLQKVTRYTPRSKMWDQLEELYGASSRYDKKKSFYQFLTKAATIQAGN